MRIQLFKYPAIIRWPIGFFIIMPILLLIMLWDCLAAALYAFVQEVKDGRMGELAFIAFMGIWHGKKSEYVISDRDTVTKK